MELREAYWRIICLPTAALAGIIILMSKSEGSRRGGVVSQLMSYSFQLTSIAVSGGGVSEWADVTELAVDVGLNELLFASESSVLSEVGVDGRERFRYSGVNWGVENIFVSTQGVSFNAPELSLLSRREMPVLT